MQNATCSIKPSPMEGGGHYNRSSRVQAEGLLPAIALLEQGAHSVPLALSPVPIVLADYGCSQGYNSLFPLSLAIKALRSRMEAEQPICVVHTDLPGNDFSTLFNVLENDPDSYLRSDPATFASAVGRSFYTQLLPSNSVTLGWSSWAIQWLSQAPTTIPDQVQIAYSRDPAVRAAFAGQAATDWRLFLQARAKELRQGGRLVVLTMAIDEHGEFGYRPLLEAIYAALTTMIQTGFISADELQRMVIPTVARSQADFLEPFNNHQRYENLAIEHLEVFHGKDRIWENYQAGGDAHSFGAQWAAFSRASVFPTLATALGGDESQRRTIPFMNLLEKEVAARLAQNPQPMLIPLAKMVLVKDNTVR